ncbi:MAG: hypothetical protein ACJ73E_02805 [Mycobacteriales bacterium]
MAVLLLSGCADPTPVEPGGGATPATAAPTTPPVTPRPTKPADPSGSGRPVTLDGVVDSGVEPGCKVLTAAGGTYLLLGGDVPVGVPVRVTGVLQPGVLTTCQQGTPIRVTRVQRR